MFGHDDQLQNSATGQTPGDATVATDGQDASGPALNVNELTGSFAADTAATALVDVIAPVGPPASPADVPAPVEPTIPASAPTPTLSGAGELLDIKQQALQQLSPLVGHLEQPPEEKFRTTMMLIQASDNDSLLKTAYEAALQISDEKVRAQALLDIVNEINYFTHAAGSTTPQA